jgi:hypothetical protein
MSDPRDEFLKDVDFKNVAIKEHPNIAFLCGGNPSPVFDSSSSKQRFLSIRAYISAKLAIKHPDLYVKNAEDVKDWNSYSAYEDLIDFEKDIAHICKTIVLFVESAGSIAELGSFAVIPEISEKLLVFVEDKYSGSNSFLTHGPLKKLKDQESSSVCYIPWATEKVRIDGTNLDVMVEGSMRKYDDYVCDQIKTALNKAVRRDRDSDEYKRSKEMLFIHDIIVLFKALTDEEILGYFKAVKHQVSKKEVLRSLFSLTKLDLILSVEKGHQTFYIPCDQTGKRYISLAGSTDSARLSVSLAKYYDHNTHMARRDAIAQVIGSSV